MRHGIEIRSPLAIALEDGVVFAGKQSNGLLLPASTVRGYVSAGYLFINVLPNGKRCYRLTKDGLRVAERERKDSTEL